MEEKELDLNVLDTFEVIDEDVSPETLRENEERLERATTNPDEFNFSQFLKNELGIEDGKILTGDPDSPIEYDLSDLNLQQQTALLKKHYQDAQEAASLSNDERAVLEMLREGQIDSLYERLGEELGRGVQQQPEIDINQYSDDEIMLWKLKNDYPDMTDDELTMELEVLKDTPTYGKKTEGAKNLLKQTLEYQQQQNQSLAEQQVVQQKEQLHQRIIETATEIDDLFGFEVDDNLKNSALSDIIESNENGTPPIIEFLDTPEGLMQTALLWRAMPQINEYVNSLHEEIDKLRNTNKESATLIADAPKRNQDFDLDIQDFGTLETI